MSMSTPVFVPARSPLTLVYRDTQEECSASALRDLQLSGFTQEIPDDPQFVQAKPGSALSCEHEPFVTQQLAPWAPAPHPEMPLHRDGMVMYVAQRHVTREDPRLLRELLSWLGKQTWSDFAQSLSEQAALGRPLTSRQIAAARSMREKTEAKRASRSREQGRMAWCLAKAALNHGAAESEYAAAYARRAEKLAQAAQAGEVE